MKKYLIIVVCCLGTIASIHAQEYKVAKSSGKLVLNLPSAIVEGYDGNEIIFGSQKPEEEIDPRAKGLRAINGGGFVDNTGLGISVVEKGSTIEVNRVAANVAVRIKVPKGLIISFACHGVNCGDVVFKNMGNEIETSTDYNGVKLENVTGPVLVRAIYGSVDARFNEHIKGPISIASIYSVVDVSIPVDTKANIKLSSSHGTIMASSDLKIEMEKNSENDMISYGGLVNGKLNGGGTEFKLTSEYGKIYLRKSK